MVRAEGLPSGCTSRFFYQRMITIEQLNDYVQKVQESTGYRMVRTMGGDYYEEFDKEGFVAIGYNEITLHE